jgi:hypothetical protein
MKETLKKFRARFADTPVKLLQGSEVKSDFFTNWQIRVAGESGLWWVSVGWLDKN